MDKIRNKIILYIFGNAFIILITILFLILLNPKELNLNIGPNKNFIIISTTIDNWLKYLLLLLLMTFLILIKVISEDFGSSIIKPLVYDLDKNVIIGFQKNELLFISNILFTLDMFRELFIILISISQIDILLYVVVMKFMISFYSIHILLKEKIFIKNKIYYTTIQ